MAWEGWSALEGDWSLLALSFVVKGLTKGWWVDCIEIWEWFNKEGVEVVELDGEVWWRERFGCRGNGVGVGTVSCRMVCMGDLVLWREEEGKPTLELELWWLGRLLARVCKGVVQDWGIGGENVCMWVWLSCPFCMGLDRYWRLFNLWLGHRGKVFF